MHFAFIPYGKRSEVELLLRDMEAQKHMLPMWKGKKKKAIWIQAQVRILPFGICEYIFPKEDLDMVLHTLIINKIHEDRYGLGNLKRGFLRKLIKCEKIPEYKKEKNYLWVRDHVRIIPLGIREDLEFMNPDGLHKGWTHEAI